MSLDDHDHHHPALQSESLRPGRARSLPIVSSAAPPKFWRSVGERAGTAEVLVADARREFPAGADLAPEGVSRRNFVQLVGASSLLAVGAACQRPNQKIMPYVRRPPEVTPGNPLHFATAYSREGHARGLVVESHTGRPTKIEGNPDHPDSLGATSALDQAILLGLFDADRARQIRHHGAPVAWRSVQAAMVARAESMAASGGAGLRFLVEPSASPLLADLRTRIAARFPKAKVVAYSSVASEGAVVGASLTFGRAVLPRHDLSKALVILSLDADFLGDGEEQVKLGRQFANQRKVGLEMNRLYVAEPCMSITGTMSDHRVRLRGSELLGLAQALAAELGRMSGFEGLAPIGALPRAPGRVENKWLMALARDLARVRGQGVVIAGRRQPAAVHAIAAAINAALGAVGNTVDYHAPTGIDGGVEALHNLALEIAAGQVQTLVITARNPVFGAPADFKLDKLLPRVPETIYAGMHDDETAAVTSTFLPTAHSLETWGDGRAHDGTVSIQQPLIHPLWSSLSEAEILAAWVGEADKSAHTLLKEFWRKRAVDGGLCDAHGFDGAWESWLGRGVVPKTKVEPAGRMVANPAVAQALAPLVAQAVNAAGAKGGEVEIAFAVCPKVFDGRYANNAWLQELPDPITKITWDNAVLLSHTTATRLDIKTGDVVRLESGDRQVVGPAYVQPGHADDAVTVALGYGRTAGGKIANGVGFDVSVLRGSGAPWFGRVGISKTRRFHRFGITQEHWSMEGRDPVQVTTAAALAKQGSLIHQKLEHERGKLPTIHEPVDYSAQPYKWAMAIDLSKCSGCNACVVACVSENNIPVVGRENVRVGREMQWIRMDRYYEGTVEDPEVVTQPVMCMHCETAPCEYVCPVNATVHSDEGLNEMVYNRCVGTRYCSNNCPYKARRFNFLDYHQEPAHVHKMATNPDVTVRSRGVMEKCTYCVQRIERKRIDARVAGRKIADGEIETACQQVCPADAIAFGSLNDPLSKVSLWHGDERRYDLLHELGTRPRTVYLARVRNPNPELV